MTTECSARLPDGNYFPFWDDETQYTNFLYVDCGSAAAFLHSVSPYLRSRGVNRLDGVLLSAGDARQIGGVLDLLKTLAPREVIVSPLRDHSHFRNEAQRSLAQASAGKTIVWRGDALTLAPGITLHCLFPPAGFEARSASDKTLIARLDVEVQTHDASRPSRPTRPPVRILFLSNAGFISEHWLLEHAPLEELRSDILIKGMHPGDLSGSPEFLDAVRPALLVVAGGRFPDSPRVSEEWAAMVRARGIRLLRQEQTGAVHITVERDGTWSAEPYLTGKAVP